MSVVALKPRVNITQVERVLRYRLIEKNIELLEKEREALRLDILANRNNEKEIRDINQNKLAIFIDAETKKLEEKLLETNYPKEYASCLKVMTKLDVKAFKEKYEDLYDKCVTIDTIEKLKVYPGN